MRGKLFLFLTMIVLLAVAAQATTIHDIQWVEDPGTDDASPLEGQTVTVQGLVTFEPGSFGGSQFFMADNSGPWNGINVYTGNTHYELGFGWEVSVTGTVSEYNGLTEIEASSVTVIDAREDMAGFWEDLHANPGSYPEVQYTSVDASDLSDAAGAEQYEGVLVKIEDVTVEAMPDQFGEWTVTDGGNTVKIDNPSSAGFGYHHIVVDGEPFEHIQGVLNFSFSEYKVLPEIGHDLKTEVDVENGYFDQIAYTQQVRPMDMTVREFGGDYYTHDNSYCANSRYGLAEIPGDYGEDVVVHGLVTYPTGLGYVGAGPAAKFILEDYLDSGTAQPWSAVLSYTPDASLYGDLLEGDEIVFYGQIGEYAPGTGRNTEMWITDTYDFISQSNPLPPPPLVTVPELRTPSYAEQWESVFVTLQNVIVTDNDVQYYLFAFDDDLNDDFLELYVNYDSDSLAAYDSPPVGTNIESITGWIYDHYGDYTPGAAEWPYSIGPAYVEDIVVGEGPPNILSVTRDYGVVPPNAPVNVTAMIADNNLVATATVYYKVDDGGWIEGGMDHVGDLEFEYEIPGTAAGSFVTYYLEAEDDLGQTSTYPDNLETDYLGYWAKTDLTINDLQWCPWPSGVSPYDGYVIPDLTGIVTTNLINAQTYDDPEGTFPYFMQTGDTAAWSGIIVVLNQVVNIGDEITVNGGTVDEAGSGWAYKWEGSTRLINPLSVTINSTGNDAELYETSAAEVNASLESWESVQVEFNDCVITSLNPYDWTFIDGSGEHFLLDDDLVKPSGVIDPGDQEAVDIFASLESATTISSLTGVLTYSFGTWKLEIRDAGDFGTVGVSEQTAEQPLKFALAPVYPNPFNPSTTINFSVPWSGEVKLAVYNTLGQAVETLVNSPLRAGVHTLVWDAGDVASGTYFLRLVSNRQQVVQKMVVLK